MKIQDNKKSEEKRKKIDLESLKCYSTPKMYKLGYLKKVTLQGGSDIAESAGGGFDRN